jgi:hypothetical protein
VNNTKPLRERLAEVCDLRTLEQMGAERGLKTPLSVVDLRKMAEEEAVFSLMTTPGPSDSAVMDQETEEFIRAAEYSRKLLLAARRDPITKEQALAALFEACRDKVLSMDPSVSDHEVDRIANVYMNRHLERAAAQVSYAEAR